MHERISYSPLPANPASPLESAESPNSQLGTILFEGAVPPTKGIWLGVEWDDASRGKHSGVYEKTGVQYFEPRIEGAGSFLRPDAKGLDRRGKTFKQALWSKYLDIDLLSGSIDSTTAALPPQVHSAPPDEPTSRLYTTNSNFDVEVVLTSKVTEHFKQLNRLREIGLEWESVSRACDGQGEAELAGLGEQLSRLEVLNLSYSMLPSLAEVDRVVAVLPRLRHLALNSNRFIRIATPTPLSAFRRLTSLQLNGTLLSWPELINIADSLTNLVDLQFGFNRLSSLAPSSLPQKTDQNVRRRAVLPNLERLNLEGNELQDCQDLVEGLADLPNLNELILTRNRFSSLPTRSSSTSASLRQLRHLSLSDNLLTSWATSVDALAATASSMLPSLTSLRLSGNPLVSPPNEPTSTSASDSTGRTVDEAEDGQERDRVALHSRLFTIARLPFLLELEGTAVTPAEREDAERFWIEQVGVGAGDETDLSDWARGRLEELKKKHGLAPVQSLSTSGKKEKPTMKDRLIHLRIRLDPSIPPTSSAVSPELAVLPTLRTLILRTQISRLVGKPLPKTKFKLVAALRGERDGESVEVDIPPNEEGKEVSWWGLQDGDAVLVAPL